MSGIKRKRDRSFKGLLSITLTVCLLMTTLALSVYAAGTTTEVTGKFYEFDDDSHYEFSAESITATDTSPEKALGVFSISGNYTDAGGIDGIPAYTVNSGSIALSYAYDRSSFNTDDTQWHLTEDKSKNVDGLKLDKNIQLGALILQTSLDGETWTTDVTKTNVFDEGSDTLESIYTTKDIQQENGCYYRVIIVYRMRMMVDPTEIWFVSIDNYDYMKCAEVYEFYAINSNAESVSSSSDTPRKTLGNKIKVTTDSGYSEVKTLDKDDPHYGWNIGSFFVNGYTRETANDSGTPVFLKNVGDKVTLWFTLEQDINALNDDPNLTIAEDTNGYDQYFEVPKTNFGHGTLIIRFTDHEGIKHDPIIYTDYLAANARTGADTKVQLFEEGDYEVSLDYEIRNSPRNVAGVSVVPTYTDYKITFTFSIRNGNCMVYPFDTATGDELADNAITPNGFKLDMARSRYLTIDVTRSVLNVAADGTVTEDVRFNRPAKDGDDYSDEGIYVFTVKNLYTDAEPTTKTIYVGADPYLLALSNTGMSVQEMNEYILNGYQIGDDGSLVAPTPTPAPTPTTQPVAKPGQR